MVARENRPLAAVATSTWLLILIVFILHTLPMVPKEFQQSLGIWVGVGGTTD